MQRRDFLTRAGWAIGAAAVAGGDCRRAAGAGMPGAELGDWEAVRGEFELTRDRVHFSTFFLAAHPRPVREAIERHRRGFDADPLGYFHETADQAQGDVLSAASEYLGVSPTEIALTDSTTMGLGLLYGGLALRIGQEILTTTHDHYSTETSLRLAAERSGATVKRVALYRDGASASQQEIVETIVRAVTPRTRVIAVTWVHSCTGVKLPVAAIAAALGEVNAKRGEDDRALLCVDGVHGLAVDDVTLPELGCDFFVAGTHKWLYGPRGTGLVWGRQAAWGAVRPTIPTFDWQAYGSWMQGLPPRGVASARLNTPGGFHSFEHRWAVAEAFRFHERIGKARVAGRIHELNRQLKAGLSEMPRVTLHTPMNDDLSAGIVCFEVAGMEPHEAVDRLAARRIIGSVAPYASPYVRLAPCILNSPEEVEAALRAVRELA